MPEYKKKEALLRVTSKKQVELLVRALEKAYMASEPKEKIIYSRLLKKLEK